MAKSIPSVPPPSIFQSLEDGLRISGTAVVAMQRYGVLAAQSRWKQLAAHAKKLRTSAARVARQHATIATRAAQTQTRLHATEAWAKPLLARLQRTLKQATPAERQAFADNLAGQLRDPKRAQRVMQKLTQPAAPQLRAASLVGAPTRKTAALLEHDYVQLRVLATRAALLAPARLEFAASAKKATRKEMDVKRVTMALDKFVQQGFTQLYQAARKGAPRAQFVARAKRLDQAAAGLLGKLAIALGRGLAAARVIPAGTARKRALQQLLALAEAARRLELLSAYVAYCQIRADAEDCMSWYAGEIAAAKKKTFASQVPSGRPTALRDVAKARAGQLIAVEGEVKRLRTAYDPRPPKFSTFFDIVDSVTTDTVSIRAHMFNLINNGLSEAAYCRLHGTLRSAPRSRTQPKGHALLDADRIALSQLATRSWLDDVAYRMKRYSRMYPDEMNMFFTPALGR